MFGFVPSRNAEFLRAGDHVRLEASRGTGDCLKDIEEVCSISETLGRDCIVVDLSDPETGFNVVQVIMPGYSDVLPFHPASSSGLFKRWTRSDVLESYGKADSQALIRGS